MKIGTYFSISILCIVFLASCGGEHPTATKLFVADATDLKTTAISAHLEAPLAAGQNMLWCGSFQLAWNVLSDFAGEELHLVPEDPMVAVLNKRTFTHNHIDDASVAARAGFVADKIIQQIRAELTQKFGDAAQSRLLPDPDSLRPDTIVAYAYLLKRLNFATPFERLKEPLQFQGGAVESFGISGEDQPEHGAMYAQVKIWDYQQSDDFIIELQTTSSGDQVILAKVPRAATLDAQIASVRQRMAQASPIQPGIADILIVPTFNFDVTRDYTELENRPFLAVKPVLQGHYIAKAAQNIRFQMNENGVKLDSEAVIIAPGGMPPPVRRLIFDAPFLVMLQRTEATVPYLAIWVENPELFIRS